MPDSILLHVGEFVRKGISSSGASSILPDLLTCAQGLKILQVRI
jgi:hypothetical protein